MNNTTQPEVSKVYLPDELEKASIRMCHIDFDCLVTMFDSGFIEKKSMFLSDPKPNQPQWFKSSSRLTMEAIKSGTNEQIGQFIKDQFIKLEAAIEAYQKR